MYSTVSWYCYYGNPVCQDTGTKVTLTIQVFQNIRNIYRFMTSKISSWEKRVQFQLFDMPHPTCVEVVVLVLHMWGNGEGVYVQHVRNVYTSVRYFFQHCHSAAQTHDRWESHCEVRGCARTKNTSEYDTQQLLTTFFIFFFHSMSGNSEKWHILKTQRYLVYCHTVKDKKTSKCSHFRT